jgi:hypothetical protein
MLPVHLSYLLAYIPSNYLEKVVTVTLVMQETPVRQETPAIPVLMVLAEQVVLLVQKATQVRQVLLVIPVQMVLVDPVVLLA